MSEDKPAFTFEELSEALLESYRQMYKKVPIDAQLKYLDEQTNLYLERLGLDPHHIVIDEDKENK